MDWRDRMVRGVLPQKRLNISGEASCFGEGNSPTLWVENLVNLGDSSEAHGSSELPVLVA